MPPEVEALGSLDAMLDAALAGEGGSAAQAPAERTGGEAGRSSRGAGAQGEEQEDEARRAQRRLLALAIALERHGTSLTDGAGLEYRRALMRKLR